MFLQYIDVYNAQLIMIHRTIITISLIFLYRFHTIRLFMIFVNHILQIHTIRTLQIYIIREKTIEKNLATPPPLPNCDWLGHPAPIPTPLVQVDKHLPMVRGFTCPFVIVAPT